MSLKGSNTTADFLKWETMQLLIQKLLRDEDYHFGTLIAVGSYTGLRISDLKRLKWSDIDTKLILKEAKTGKLRTIHINSELSHYLDKTRAEIQPFDDDLIFPYSLQYTNRKLKKIAIKYELGIKFSTHSFRKTFGRRIWSKNNYSEKSLILLGQVFNHSSVAITKRYLGIRDKEIQDIYLNL
ncbi:MAG: tyrosine-type recombinase/integrase [Saprospiraceae bacterium]|nr:tyrosine-type recombinase/integrase [Saprospiraceae bacterium]